MTDHDLRSLLHEQVDHVTTTPDLSAGAWSRSRGVRRRSALGALGGVAVAAALVVAGVAVLGDRTPATTDPARAPHTTEPDAVPDTTPDAQFRGAPVYWSPSLGEEARLPLMTDGRPPLPERIDLSAEATPIEEEPIDRAVAVFGIIDRAESVRVLVLAPDGSYRSLDLSGVGPDPTISCCRRPPVYDEMLSPTGEYIAFPQTDGLMVYDLPRREWRAMPGGAVDPLQATWISDHEIYAPRFTGGSGSTFDVVTGERTREDVDRGPGGNELDLDRDNSYQFGPARTGPEGVLQSWGSGAVLEIPQGTPNRPEVLVATGATTRILTFTGSPGGDDRWLQCCPVVGWASDDVAMYESRSSTPRIIAWTVGTHRFEQVATITGFTPGEETYVGSYARVAG